MEKILSEEEMAKLRSVEPYIHSKDTRINNPRVGLASHDNQTDNIHTYSFDVHNSPTLDWAGKAENSSFDIPVSSIHVHETVIPQRAVNRFQKITPQTQLQQLTLFPELDPIKRIQEQARAIEAYQHLDKWKNRLVAGDSLIIMNSLLHKEGMAGKVQMVYIDPPYGIKYGSNFQPFVNKRDVTDKSDDDLSAEPETIKAFRDTWELGIHSYLTYLRNRLLLVHELLTDSGSVFVQISDENVHHVREICDEIFGVENFVSQIVYTKTTGFGNQSIANVVDYVIWYAKNKEVMKYHSLYKEKVFAGEGASAYSKIELANGTRISISDWEKKNECKFSYELRPRNSKVYALDNLTSQGETDTPNEIVFNDKRYTPPKGSHWKTHKEGMERLLSEHRIDVSSKGNLGYVRYFEDFKAMPITGLWTDTVGQNQFGGDKMYVVQTANITIQRCMLMTTDPNDLVLDITCGSGTTAYVAEQWGRRWITCDTSRIAIAIARQRLLTATFDYYTLADNNKGIAGGFVYTAVPHITLKSIANNEEPGKEILYDRPIIDRKKVRISGPFTVESLPAPVVFSPDEAINIDSTAKHSDWSEQMKATGISGTHGEKLRFKTIDLFPGTKWINAEAYTDEETPRRAFIAFADECNLMDTRRVYGAYQEALKFPHDIIIFAAFQFDPAVYEMIKDIRGLIKSEILQVNMNTDLMTQDLRRKARTDSLFWLVGQPDISLERVEDNSYRVKVLGFDYYNVNKGIVESGNTDKIAMWMLDTDYNSMELNPSQIFFPMAGKSDGWSKLAKTLQAEIDIDLMEAFRGTESLEFDAKPEQKIAVKIIDDRGIESLRVLTVEEAV